LINTSIDILFKASYGVEDAEFAVTQLAQTTMRSEIGKIALDTLFRERELLNAGIVGKSFVDYSFLLIISFL
jgi:regulator of protease activity HflC (stomatin/prohibitin superfamily)